MAECESLWMQMRAITRRGARYCRKDGKSGKGVSKVRWEILLALSLGETHNQLEIAKRSTLAPPVISNELRAMEGEGLVVRRRSTADGRKVCILLTGEGRSLYDEMLTRRANLDELLFAGESEENRALFAAMLQRMRARLEEQEERESSPQQ